MGVKFPIRVGARALIFEGESVLLIKYDDETGPHYNYPGGGVEMGESVKEAVLREILEETSAKAQVERLLNVYEYVPAHYNGAYGETQKLSLLFLCTLLPGEIPVLPINPDLNQVGVEWVPLKELNQVQVYPQIADAVLASFEQPKQRDIFLENTLSSE